MLVASCCIEDNGDTISLAEKCFCISQQMIIVNETYAHDPNKKGFS